MSTVTREHLAVAVYEVLGLSKEDAVEVTGALFDVMADALLEKHSVHISGFGKFIPRVKPAYRGVSPTGLATVHAEHWTVRWQRSELLLERLNAEAPTPVAVIKPKPRLQVQPKQRHRFDRRLKL